MSETYFDDNALLALIASDPAEHAGGPSEVMDTLRCARYAALKRQLAKEDGPDLENLGPRTFWRDAGTITHKLVELYSSGEDPEACVAQPECVDNIPLQDRLAKAWRLFRRYKAVYEPDFWGELLGVEVKLNPGRVDALWNITPASQARIVERFQSEEPPPLGVMAWDLKTGKQKDNELHAKYEWSLQGGMYLPRLVDLGITPASFGIFQAANYERDSTKWDFFTWYPAEHFLGEDGRRRTAAATARAEREATSNECNLSGCFMYGECGFKQNGMCRGY